VKPLRIAVLGTSHVHLADHLAALDRPGLSRAAGLPQADAVILGGSPADRERLLAEMTEMTEVHLPVLAEKPLARSAPATAALLRRWQGHLTTAMFLRCSPVFAALRHAVAAGTLGDIAAVHADFSHPGWWDGVFTGAAAWMGDEEQAPGGALADLAVHLLDVLLWIRPDWPLTVCAADRIRSARAGSARAGAVVAGSALLRWGPALVTLHTGWTSRPGGLRVAMDGSHGRAVVDGGELTLVNGSSGPRTVHRGPAPAAADAVHAFVGELRGAGSVLPRAADILRCAELADRLIGPDG
jgi:predicted dehydrogenase